MSETTTAHRGESSAPSAPLPSRRRSSRVVPGPAQHLAPLGIVTAAVVLVNLPPLLHVVSTDPVQLFGLIGLGGVHQAVVGYPTIDPNAGFITQAFGHLVSSDWVHGHLPWWNPYEGVGAPLAGEMQSAAFFPPTLLLNGTWGFVPFHLLLELVAGWSTYFLLRRLGTGRAAATAAGVAFGLCGTFAWMTHSTVNPVALLPLALLGVERALDRARRGRGGGWLLVGVALGLSVVAGWPETAYLDGLLVLAWAVVRLAGARSRLVARRAVGKLAAGGLLGAALSAPAWVAFVDYLPHANVGEHSGAVASWVEPTTALPQLVMPYSLGPIAGFHSTGAADVFAGVWGNVGGYLSAALVACALVGAVGRRLRGLRLMLVAWVLLALGRTFGFPPFADVVNAVPGVRLIAVYRYIPASWALAVAVLAGLGIDDVLRRRVPRTVVIGAVAVTAALAAWATATVWPLLGASSGAAHRRPWAGGSFLWAVGTLLLLAAGALVAGTPPRRDGAGASPGRHRLAAGLLAGTVVVDAMVLFAVPLLSAPRPRPIDVGVVRFLRQHIGLERFATLGPIQPNFGSYFGLQEVNVNDLPLPKAYSRYVSTHLDPGGNPLLFTGITAGPGHNPAQDLADHLADYEAVGVKYVVESGTGFQGVVFPPASEAGTVTLAYKDASTRVYELPDPAPFFAAPGACSVAPRGLEEVTVSCPTPSVLVRRELDMPGWTATVGGRRAAVSGVDGLFQSVPVPGGTSTVRFRFAPVHAAAALVACGAGLLTLVGGALWPLRGGRHRRPRRRASTTSAPRPA